MRNKLICIIVILFALSYPTLCFSHSGRTDSSGGHRDNQNKSGLGYYHYHCGGHPAHLHENGVCPYSSNYSEGSDSGSSASKSKSYATNIKITNKPKSLNIGEPFTLEVELYPDDVDEDSIKWKSSNKKIATVNSDGEVIPAGVGKVTITATTSNGQTASFKLDITEVKTESLEIQDKQEKITIGDNITLNAKFTPENTTNTQISWESNNEDVVIVSKSGKLYAVGEGAATVYARQGDNSDCFKIEVFPEVSAVVLSQKELKIKVGNSESLNYNIEPYNALDTTIKFKSNNKDIASVQGNKICAVAAGETIITATSINGKQDAIFIKVYSNTGYIVAAIVLIILILGALIIVYVKRKGLTHIKK